jgi:hypothetical protein
VPIKSAIAVANKAMQDGSNLLLDSIQERHSQTIPFLKEVVKSHGRSTQGSASLDRQGTWSVRASRVLALGASCSPPSGRRVCVPCERLARGVATRVVALLSLLPRGCGCSPAGS